MERKTLLITVSIFSLALISSAVVVSKSSFSLRTTQTNVTKEGSLTNAISVSGDGTSVVKPDIVRLNVRVSENAFKVSDAQRMTNEKINQVIEIAKKYQVDQEDIKTTRINISPKYEWENRRSVFKGYDSVHELSLKIDYQDEKGPVAQILDEISQIDNMQVTSISFDIEDKEPIVKQARELAYESAEEKAQQLAKLSGINLGKPISIIDSSSTFKKSDYAPRMDMAAFGAPVAEMAEEAQIFGGELEVRVVLNVVYAIE